MGIGDWGLGIGDWGLGIGDIRTSRLIKSYQNSIVNSKILNSDNNFINNINNPNKLMNKQIINHSQINYQIPVFIPLITSG